jgi:multidrug efflux system outer membrane protein
MRSAMLLTCVSLLSACSLAPRHERPGLPTATEYPADYRDDAPNAARASTLGWTDFFPDQRLQALLRIALRRNRDLTVAVTQIREARAQYGIERANRLPTIGLDAGATRTRVGRGSAGLSGAQLPSGAESATFDRYSAAVGISAFELDFWGRVRNLSEAALSQYLAAEHTARAFRLSLLRDVAITYLTTIETEERIRLAQATVQSRRDGLRIAERRLQAGVTSALDYRQAESLLTQAETELAALQLTQAQNQNLLMVLIGGPLDEQLPAGLPLADQWRVQALSAGLPSDLLTARPDVQAAEERLRAARANVGAARAAFLPSIALTGSFGYASTELDELFGDDGHTWSFGPILTVPLFDFGRRRANLDLAEAREVIAVANYERVVQTAFQEVADALAGRRFLAEQEAAQERNTDAQRRIADLARTRYREGVVSYLEVLDAERNLFAAEQALLQVRRAEAANLVALYVALGGGVEE